MAARPMTDAARGRIVCAQPQMVGAIRTFLSFALHLEIEGRLPWQATPPTGVK